MIRARGMAHDAKDPPGGLGHQGRMGSASRKRIEANLRQHYILMQKLMAQGMEKEAASNKALELMKERKEL